MMNVSIIFIISLTMMIVIIGSIHVIPIPLTILTEADGSLDKSEFDVGPENDAAIKDSEVAEVIDDINKKNNEDKDKDDIRQVIKSPQSTPVEDADKDVADVIDEINKNKDKEDKDNEDFQHTTGLQTSEPVEQEGENNVDEEEDVEDEEEDVED